ncbi:MAG TPA: hypothetical protein PLT28_00325 [Saprospiraceae bacterium]|nr:hypothetical protein [Saprospiraceae bacterium]
MAYGIMRRELRQPDGAWLIAYVCDADADVTDVPKDGIMGSSLFVIGTGETYYLDSTVNWSKPNASAVE